MNPLAAHVLRGPPRVGTDISIALVTMTKNGLKKLPRLFASVLGFADKALILDTGSTDGTLEWLDEQKLLPVEKWARPFVDFQVSRNQLMEFAQDKADWLLLLDDDMELTCMTKAPPWILRNSLNLSTAAYMLKHAGNLEYWVTRLVRGNRLWIYQGVTHEYLVGGGVGNPRFEGLEIEHHYKHGPEKFRRDLRLLSADIARNPDDQRTIFYLANTLRDMNYLEAAIRFYIMRASMGGWDEEVYVSMYEAARLAEDPRAMQKVYEFRPTRAEPAAWLTLYYAKIKQQSASNHWEEIRRQIGSSTDSLFVIQSAYGPTLRGL